jgi:hypothetical protein
LTVARLSLRHVVGAGARCGGEALTISAPVELE